MTQTDILDHLDTPEQYGISAKLDMNLVAVGTKAGMRTIGTSSDMFMVDPRKVKIFPGFNPRIKDEKYWAKVKLLADSMEEIGFMRDKPLACYVVKENGETVVYAVEGGRRLDASLERMRRFKTDAERDQWFIAAVPKDKHIDEIDLNYGLYEGNDNEPFRPYELAVLVKRLIIKGQTEQQILKRMTKISAAYLRDLLTVAGAPKFVADKVIGDEISVTTAANMMRKHGNKVIEVMKQAQANAEAEGKTKITDRYMPGAKLKKALVREAPELYKSAQKVVADPGFAGLSEETRAFLEDLMRDLAQSEDKPVAQSNDEQIAIEGLDQAQSA